MVYKLTLDKKHIKKNIFYSEDSYVRLYAEVESNCPLWNMSFWDEDTEEYISYIKIHELGSEKKIYLLPKCLYKNANKNIYMVENKMESEEAYMDDEMQALSVEENYFTSSALDGSISMTFTVWDKVNNEGANDLPAYSEIVTKVIVNDGVIEPTYDAEDIGGYGLWRQEITESEYFEAENIVVSGYHIDTEGHTDLEVLPTKLELKKPLETLVDEILDSDMIDDASTGTMREAFMAYFKYLCKNEEVVNNQQKFIYKGVSINTNFFESKSNELLRSNREL